MRSSVDWPHRYLASQVDAGASRPHGDLRADSRPTSSTSVLARRNTAEQRVAYIGARHPRGGRRRTHETPPGAWTGYARSWPSDTENGAGCPGPSGSRTRRPDTEETAVFERRRDPSLAGWGGRVGRWPRPGAASIQIRRTDVPGFTPKNSLVTRSVPRRWPRTLTARLLRELTQDSAWPSPTTSMTPRLVMIPVHHACPVTRQAGRRGRLGGAAAIRCAHHDDASRGPRAQVHRAPRPDHLARPPSRARSKVWDHLHAREDRSCRLDDADHPETTAARIEEGTTPTGG